jgi:hypothetical protein
LSGIHFLATVNMELTHLFKSLLVDIDPEEEVLDHKVIL